MPYPITIQDLCSKLELVETSKTYGATFLNQIKIFEYTPDVFMCTADKNGYPLANNYMRCFCPKTHLAVTVTFEFLMDASTETLHQLLDEIL